VNVEVMSERHQNQPAIVGLKLEKKEKKDWVFRRACSDDDGKGRERWYGEIGLEAKPAFGCGHETRS